MINIVSGNLLDATEDIIGHQVNCQGVMGSGVGAQIKEKYPKAFSHYKRWCELFKDCPKLLLGDCHLSTAGGKRIAHLYGQLNYGRNKKIVYTNYEALNTALVELKHFAGYSGLSIALPYGIGCGLANGDWEGVVYPMLQEIFNDYDVTLYKYEG